MWFSHVPAAALLLSGVLAAQGMRLDHRVERPLLYLAQRAPVAGGEDVLASLHEEVLLGALGLGSGSRTVKKEVDAGGAMLRSVQRLLARLSRFSEASEMALVGMVPLRGQTGRRRPLLVFHTYLREDGVAEMQKLLDSGEFAAKGHRVHDRQVYRFKSDANGDEVVEIALVDRDMVVSNDARTLARMLDPRTTAGGGFASSPRFVKLRKQLDVPPGSLLFYADWRALRARFDQVFRGDATWLMSLSGVEHPEQLMFVARPAPRKAGQRRGIITSFLLQHASDSRKFGAKPSDHKATRSWHPDGWLDLLQPARVKDLLAGLPQGGTVTFAAMLDFDKVLPTHSSRRVRKLQASIFYRCAHLGIDLRREILRRLDAAAGAQLLMLEPAPDAVANGAGMRLAWSMRAKSTRDARELFKVLQRMFVPSGDARLHGTGHRQELRFTDTSPAAGPDAEADAPVEDALVLALVHDSIVVAFSSPVIAQVRKMTAAARRTPSSRRVSTTLMSRLQRLGVKPQQRLAGVFGLDLGFLAARPDGDSGGKNGFSKSRDRRAGILGLHGGYFSFEKGLVRLEVFTELNSP